MIVNQLRGKSVLFFCVQTFGLENQIAEKLRDFGAIVDYYDERPKNNNWTKAVIRVKKELYRRKIDTYYQKILQQIKNKSYDFLLVIRGEVVPEFFIKAFKAQNSHCKLIFYNWDSFKNTNHSLPFLPLFDKKLSFDPYDAKQYQIAFRPLYFIDIFREVNPQNTYEIDLLFLGTAHSDRYIISNTLKVQLEKKGLKVFCFYFMQGKWVYFLKRMIDKSFKTFDYKKLSFSSLNTDEIIELYRKSKVILDINHPNQSGLTMRTFESIGAGKKLITTNKEIRKMPFFNDNNVFVLDRNHLKVDVGFFEKPYVNLDKQLYEKFSIEGWIYNLFIDDEQDFWSKYI